MLPREVPPPCPRPPGIGGSHNGARWKSVVNHRPRGHRSSNFPRCPPVQRAGPPAAGGWQKAGGARVQRCSRGSSRHPGRGWCRALPVSFGPHHASGRLLIDPVGRVAVRRLSCELALRTANCWPRELGDDENVHKSPRGHGAPLCRPRPHVVAPGPGAAVRGHRRSRGARARWAPGSFDLPVVMTFIITVTKPPFCVLKRVFPRLFIS